MLCGPGEMPGLGVNRGVDALSGVSPGVSIAHTRMGFLLSNVTSTVSYSH